MRISKTLVKQLLGYVTVGYFDHHDEPPKEIAEFGPAAENLRNFAERSGNMPWLKLAIAHLLSDPDVNLREYNGGQYPFREETMRELLEFLWQTYWPDERLPATGEGPLVEIVNISNAEWDAIKKAATPGIA